MPFRRSITDAVNRARMEEATNRDFANSRRALYSGAPVATAKPVALTASTVKPAAIAQAVQPQPKPLTPVAVAPVATARAVSDFTYTGPGELLQTAQTILPRARITAASDGPTAADGISMQAVTEIIETRPAQARRRLPDIKKEDIAVAAIITGVLIVGFMNRKA